MSLLCCQCHTNTRKSSSSASCRTNEIENKLNVFHNFFFASFLPPFVRAKIDIYILLLHFFFHNRREYGDSSAPKKNNKYPPFSWKWKSFAITTTKIETHKPSRESVQGRDRERGRQSEREGEKTRGTWSRVLYRVRLEAKLLHLLQSTLCERTIAVRLCVCIAKSKATIWNNERKGNVNGESERERERRRNYEWRFIREIECKVRDRHNEMYEGNLLRLMDPLIECWLCQHFVSLWLRPIFSFLFIWFFVY